MSESKFEVKYLCIKDVEDEGFLYNFNLFEV